MNTLEVLLVEDRREDELVIARLLKDHHNLTVARTLQDAIAYLSQSIFSVALLDLTLPDSVGFATFEAFNLAVSGKLPVVILTGIVDTQMAQRAIAYGAQDYLVKDDLSQARLLATLSYAVTRHERARQLGQLTDDQREVIAAVAGDIYRTWQNTSPTLFRVAEQISSELTRLHQLLIPPGLADDDHEKRRV